MRTRSARLALAFAALTLAASVKILRDSPASQASSAAEPAGPEAVAVRSGTLVRPLLVTGELVPVHAVRITVPKFRERGSVPIQAMAPEGSRVKPGDLLLQIDSANLLASLHTEKIQLEKALNDRIKTEAEQEITIKDLEREAAKRQLDLAKADVEASVPQEFLGLWEWQNRQLALEKAQKEHETAAGALERARKAAGEEIALAQMKYEQTAVRIRAIETDLAGLSIMSDREGTVLYEYAPLTWNSGEARRKFQVGDQVSSGMVILSVPDLTEMEVRAYVSEVDGGRVRPGQRVWLAADAHPDKELEGTVDSIAEVAEELRRRSNVRVFVSTIRLDRTDPAYMKLGMSVRAEILTGEMSGPIVPRSAVHRAQGKYYVQRRGGGRSEVAVEARNATSFLVRGLAEGDIIELRR